ncbi:hypothetical protein BC826DRAFT_1174589 [Russula brevipes]|nr:hypothetical protein BC826DRAFT_1174589 [Russula brevipes]
MWKICAAVMSFNHTPSVYVEGEKKRIDIGRDHFVGDMASFAFEGRQQDDGMWSATADLVNKQFAHNWKALNGAEARNSTWNAVTPEKIAQNTEASLEEHLMSSVIHVENPTGSAVVVKARQKDKGRRVCEVLYEKQRHTKKRQREGDER